MRLGKMTWTVRRGIAVALVMISGCGGTVLVDGFNVNPVRWERERAALVQRSSFDLSCPSDQLQLTVLSARNRYVFQVAVMGCERRAVYNNGFNGVWGIDGQPTSQ